MKDTNSFSSFLKNKDISKVFNKLRRLEFFFITKILNIENIRIKLLVKEKEKASKILLTKLNNTPDLFIINKQQKKIKKNEILTLLKNNQLEELLNKVHFPSKILLKIGEEVLDKKSFSLLKEITDDEKKSLEIITGMHYPIILDLVNKKIKTNMYFLKYENDLINEGFIGIIEAIYKFQLNKQNKFITYAVPWINYHINSFIKKTLKEINSKNGNYKVHIFKNKIFEDEEKIKDFINKIYDYDFHLPLAYLFPKLRFDKINILKSNLNMILNNYSYSKRIINYCKNNKLYTNIITEYIDKPEIATRLILEKTFPYITKMNKNYYQNSEEEIGKNQYFSTKEENLIQKHEKENMIEIILKEATPAEKQKIEDFLEEKITFRKIKPIINKIKERLEKKKII